MQAFQKNATSLENELDQQILAFTKISTRAFTKDQTTGTTASNTSPTINNEQLCESIALEIEQLIKKLEKVNEQMVHYAHNHPEVHSADVHQCEQHKESLNDFKREFKRLKKNFVEAQNRVHLLDSVEQDINDYNGLNSRTSRLMNDRDHIINAERLADQVASQAIQVKENLKNQRGIFSNIDSNLTQMRTRFPMIDGLLGRIYQKRQKDMIILAVFIAVCFFVTYLLIVN